MSQKLLSSLTAALIISTLGTAQISYASQPEMGDEGTETNVSLDDTVPPDDTNLNQVAVGPSSGEPENLRLNEVSKVGEYQSQTEGDSTEEPIAIIQPHQMQGRQAATLYVQNIPVLTFLDPGPAIPESNVRAEASIASGAEATVKVGSFQEASSVETPSALPTGELSSAATEETQPSDSMGRATAIAAQINQLHQNNVDAANITARWDADRERYVIQVNGNELVEMNPDTTILPDTTSDPAADVLQATNRIRRLLGNASPLTEIEGRPQPPPVQQVSLGPIQIRIRGMASWYGPGFNGRRSANGEVFAQNGLTAAHRSLPFGTQVRVTNLNTGLSVVVRITDRGPFAHGRVIDLSAGAARLIGLVRSGVAPVSLDVLGRPTALASN